MRLQLAQDMLHELGLVLFFHGLAKNMLSSPLICLPLSHLLPEDGLGLPSESLLLPVVPPPALGHLGLGALLVLGHLEDLVRLALLVLAVRATGLGDVHLERGGGKHGTILWDTGTRSQEDLITDGLESVSSTQKHEMEHRPSAWTVTSALAACSRRGR